LVATSPATLQAAIVADATNLSQLAASHKITQVWINKLCSALTSSTKQNFHPHFRWCMHQLVAATVPIFPQARYAVVNSWLLLRLIIPTLLTAPNENHPLLGIPLVDPYRTVLSQALKQLLRVADTESTASTTADLSTDDPTSRVRNSMHSWIDSTILGDASPPPPLPETPIYSLEHTVGLLRTLPKTPPLPEPYGALQAAVAQLSIDVGDLAPQLFFFRHIPARSTSSASYYHQHSQRVVFVKDNGRVEIYDAESGDCLSIVETQNKLIHQIFLSIDSDKLYICSEAGYQIWDLHNLALLASPRRLPVLAGSLAPTNPEIWLSTVGALDLISLQNDQVMTSIPISDEFTFHRICHLSNGHLGLGSTKGDLALFNVATKSRTAVLSRVHETPISFLLGTAANHLWSAAQESSEVKIFTTIPLAPVWTLATSDHSPVVSLQSDPVFAVVWIASAQGSIASYEAASFVPLCTIEAALYCSSVASLSVVWSSSDFHYKLWVTSRDDSSHTLLAIDWNANCTLSAEPTDSRAPGSSTGGLTKSRTWASVPRRQFMSRASSLAI
jgi:hypothetical protein